MTKRRQDTAAFTARVVLEIISGAKSQAELARQHGIEPDVIARWRRWQPPGKVVPAYLFSLLPGPCSPPAGGEIAPGPEPRLTG
ncbi:MAG: transposase [Candidatus Promineifilaceae bacterium]